MFYIYSSKAEPAALLLVS